MNLFNRLPGYVRSPPGLERTVLARMPMIFAIGVAVLMTPSLVLRLGNWNMHPLHMDHLISRTDIYSTAGFVLYCNLSIVATLAAFIVMVMKGPAYVADAYPLSDSDSPAWPPPNRQAKAWRHTQ